MSFLTGTNTELIYASTAAGTEKASFTSEVAINDTSGMGVQAHIPPDFWLPNKMSNGRGLLIKASGIVSSTATPTFQWIIRGGAAGATTGAKWGDTGALTTASGISNVRWYLELALIMETIGAAGANSTARGIGYLLTDGYSAATTTRMYPFLGEGASPGTTTTVDTTITNYINFNVVCSASSSSNKITLQQLLVFGLN